VRTIRIGTKNPVTYQCRHCHQSIRTGQVALICDMPNNPITDRTFAVHVTCMRNLVASAPADHDEQTFHELRDRIATTRCAFPD
jgi:hypothetical protein